MDEATLRAADRNYCEANGAFMATSRQGELYESERLHLVSCGIRARAFNIAFFKAPVGDPADGIRRAEAFFGERALPFRFTVRHTHEDDCAPVLRQMGYERREETPGMLLAPLRESPRPPAELEIRPVEGPEDLAAFQRIAFEAFGLPAELGAAYLTEQLLALSQVRFYLGCHRGEPVATSLLFLTGDVAGIYWVATASEQRGRGFGEALTWAAVGGGRERGARFASLQASALGEPVYGRMGFETPIRYVHYEPRQ